MHRSSIVLEGMADLMDALLPETEEEIPRSRVRLRKEDKDLIIEIEAEDTSALRATLSSYLRWISAGMSAKKAMEE